MELGCDLLLADDVRLEATVDNIPLGEALEGARLHRRGGVGVGAGARPAGVRHGELGLVEGADSKTPDQIGRDFVAEHRPSSLLGRLIKPSEIASLVAYVASPLSAATNGAALRAEGGLVQSVI